MPNHNNTLFESGAQVTNLIEGFDNDRNAGN